MPNYPDSTTKIAKSYYEIEARKFNSYYQQATREHKPYRYTSENARKFYAQQLLNGKNPAITEVMVNVLNVYARYVQTNFSTDHYNLEYIYKDEEPDYTQEFRDFQTKQRNRLLSFGYPEEVLDKIDAGEIYPDKKPSIDDYVKEIIKNAPKTEEEIEEDDEIEQIKEEIEKVNSLYDVAKKQEQWREEFKAEEKENKLSEQAKTSQQKEEPKKEDPEQYTENGKVIVPLEIKNSQNKRDQAAEGKMLSKYLKLVNTIRNDQKNADLADLNKDLGEITAFVNNAFENSRYFTQEELDKVNGIVTKYGETIPTLSDFERAHPNYITQEELDRINRIITNQNDTIPSFSDEEENKEEIQEIPNEQDNEKKEEPIVNQDNEQKQEPIVNLNQDEIMAVKEGDILPPLSEENKKPNPDTLVERTKENIQRTFNYTYKPTPKEEKAIHAVKYAIEYGLPLSTVSPENIKVYNHMQDLLSTGIDETKVSKEDLEFIKAVDEDIDKNGTSLSNFTDEQRKKYSFMKREYGLLKISESKFKSTITEFGYISRVHAERPAPRWYHFFTISPFYRSNYNKEAEYLKTLEKDLVKKGFALEDLKASTTISANRIFRNRCCVDMNVFKNINNKEQPKIEKETSKIQTKQVKVIDEIDKETIKTQNVEQPKIEKETIKTQNKQVQIIDEIEKENITKENEINLEDDAESVYTEVNNSFSEQLENEELDTSSPEITGKRG